MSLSPSGHWYRTLPRLLVPALVPLLLLVWYLGARQGEADEQEARLQLESLAANLAVDQSQALGTARTLLETAAMSDDVRHARVEASREYFVRLLAGHPELRNLALLDNKGTILAAARGDIAGVQLGPQVFVHEAMTSREFTVSRFLHDMVRELPALYCLLPITENGEVRGVLLAALNLSLNVPPADAAFPAGISVFLADTVGNAVPVRNGTIPNPLPKLPADVQTVIRNADADAGIIPIKDPAPLAGLLAYVRLREPRTGRWVLTCAAGRGWQSTYAEAHKKAAELFALTFFCVLAGILAACATHRLVRFTGASALPGRGAEDALPRVAAAEMADPEKAPDPWSGVPTEGTPPDAPVTRDVAPTAKPVPRHRDGPLAGIAVLVADDSDMNRQVVKRMLEEMGITVTTAANGLEALALLEASPYAFQAVLMDVEMPLMDGLTATRLLRENLALRDLPVIAMTAYTRPEEVETCRRSGMTAHLSKPIQVRQLHETLARLAVPFLHAGRARVEAAGEDQGVFTPAGQPPRKSASEARELDAVSVFLDMEPALARLGGDLLLYYNTVTMARESLPRQEQSFRAAFASGDKAHLLSALYSLRAQAGIIGAMALVKTCSAMERDMRDLDALPGAAAVQSLHSILGWTLEALETILPALEKQLPRHAQGQRAPLGAKAPEPMSDGPACPSPALVITLFAHLLRSHDATAPVFFKANRAAFDSLCAPGAVTAMEQALRSFDYEAVLHLLEPQD